MRRPAWSGGARRRCAGRRSAGGGGRRAGPPGRPARGSWCGPRPARWRGGRRRGAGRSPRRRPGWRAGRRSATTAAARSSNSSTPGAGRLERGDGDELLAADARAPPATWPAPARRGSPSTTARARSAAPSITCSQLSSTSSARCGRAGRRRSTRSACAPGRLVHVEDVGDGPGHVARRGDLGQLDQPGPTVAVDLEPAGRGHGEPGLADAARAHERHDRRPASASATSVELVVAADEAARAPGEVAAAGGRRCADGGCSPSPSWRMRCSPGTPSRR